MNLAASLLAPEDSLETRNAKLLKMTSVLMARVERSTEDSGAAFAHFQRALMLEDQVRDRTRDLERTLDQLNQSNARLSQAMREAEGARADLYDALELVREGFALFDQDDRLVMSNSRFCELLPDLPPRLEPGLRFIGYVALVARSPHLALQPGRTRFGWLKERLRHHRLQSVTFNVQTTTDRWIQVSEQRTPGGGTAILQTDITELIQLERQERDKLLDEQARLIRATLDHVGQGIAIFDAGNRLVGWNERLRQLFMPPMRLLRVGTGFAGLAEHLRAALRAEDAAAFARLVAWVNTPDGRPPLDLQITTRNGIRLDAFGQEMPDRGFVVSFTDVTAEREARLALLAANEGLEQRVRERTVALESALSQAERANASKSRFVAAVSHDLLQPLSAAKLFLAALDSAASPDEVALTVSRARSAFESVESILGALLDISRLDSGAAGITPATFPLDGLLTRLGDEFRELARQKRLELRVVPSSLVVRSDASYLRRIVQNLIANAVRYTSAGKVLVGVRRAGGAARIEIWDTGPGIPAADREAVFHEFHRLANGHTAGGMGLGLAIVERACALLDHPLELISEEGRGTGFRITVPLAGERPARSDGHVPETLLPQDVEGVVAMVVENDASVRTALVGLLETWGVSALDAASPSEALGLLADLGIAPDVIVADYHLDNGRNGLEVIAALRAQYGVIPAILVTADRSRRLADRCGALGIPLLNKPVEPARLRALLARCHPARAVR
ncbi:MAG: PAS-domain containing protein [Amaricoccus sp.]|uniref:hybrid sensor histidine kinase/response regulator n=1 Tax=Amaricoccus sp. TaxID=1872485 RepID=UPI0039E6E9DA